MVIWFCGLSASGKSTLAWALLGILKRRGQAVLLIDGDDLRKIAPGIGHTERDRATMAGIKAALVGLVKTQGLDVIVTGVTPPTEKPRGCFEIFLDIPIEELRRRDPKRLYATGTQDVMGVDIPYPRPTSPDLIISLGDQVAGVDHCLRLILLALEVRNR